MGTPISGKDGKIMSGATTLDDVIGWEFNEEVFTTRFASSSSPGVKRSIPGSSTGDGSFTVKTNSVAAQTVKRGDQVVLKLYEDATHFWTGPATIKNSRRRVDIDDGAVNETVYAFEQDGAWTAPTYP